MSSCSQEVSYIWHTDEISLKSLAEDYGDYLPVLAIATASKHPAWPEKQVLWVQRLIQQTRVIAEDGEKRQYSLQHGLPDGIIPTDDNGKETGSLAPLPTLQRFNFFKFRSPRNLYYPWTQAPRRIDPGSLEIEDIRQESFLILHDPYSVGGVNSRSDSRPAVTVLPTNLPVRLAVAVQVYGESLETFHKVHLRLQREAETRGEIDIPDLLPYRSVRDDDDDYEHIYGGALGDYTVLPTSTHSPPGLVRSVSAPAKPRRHPPVPIPPPLPPRRPLRRSYPPLPEVDTSLTEAEPPLPEVNLALPEKVTLLLHRCDEPSLKAFLTNSRQFLDRGRDALCTAAPEESPSKTFCVALQSCQVTEGHRKDEGSQVKQSRSRSGSAQEKEIWVPLMRSPSCQSNNTLVPIGSGDRDEGASTEENYMYDDVLCRQCRSSQKENSEQQM